jgi:hypothetical protein
MTGIFNLLSGITFSTLKCASSRISLNVKAHLTMEESSASTSSSLNPANGSQSIS